MRSNSSSDFNGRTGDCPNAYSSTERHRDVSRRRFLAAAAAVVGAPAIVAAGRAAETTDNGGLIDCQSHLFCFRDDKIWRPYFAHVHAPAGFRSRAISHPCRTWMRPITIRCIRVWGNSADWCEELDAKVYRPWTLKELPMMESWLEQNGPVLDLVSEAVRKPTFCIPLVRADADKALVESLSMEGLKRPRSFARMLQTRAHYRIGTGELDGAIDDIITCQRLGRHMEHQGTLVARLVGIAIQGIAGALGIAADQKSQPNEAQLQRLVKELNALPPRPDMERLWLIERYCTLDAIQAVAVRKESLEGAFALLGNVRELWGQDSGFKAGLAIAEYISVDWNTVLRRANAHFDDIDDVHGFQRPRYGHRAIS